MYFVALLLIIIYSRLWTSKYWQTKTLFVALCSSRQTRGHNYYIFWIWCSQYEALLMVCLIVLLWGIVTSHEFQNYPFGEANVWFETPAPKVFTETNILLNNIAMKLESISETEQSSTLQCRLKHSYPG